MNTNNQSTSIFLALSTVLAAGVLTGCQYCEPLLMATLVIGAVYKGLDYSSFAKTKVAGTKRINQKH